MLNLKEKYILELLNKSIFHNYDLLSSNPEITWNVVLETIDKPWSYEYLL